MLLTIHSCRPTVDMCLFRTVIGMAAVAKTSIATNENMVDGINLTIVGGREA